MKAKFTPGPWTIDPSMELGLAVIQDNEDGEGIAELGPQRTIENIANAKLIAAAPSLLEAAEQVVAAYGCECLDEGPKNHCPMCALQQAIRKAGE